MKSLMILGLILATGAGVEVVHAGDAPRSDEPPVFAVGWQNGVTLHWRFAGVWYIEGAAGPNDFLLDSTTTGSDPQIVDDKRECGWTRLVLGRSFWRRDCLDLQAVCGICYLWDNSQDNDTFWDDVFADSWTSKSKLSNDCWEVFVAMRPRWRVHERVSVGFDLGFARSWNHLYETTVENRPWIGSGPQTTTRREHESAFTTWGGWDGLGTLHFLFWF